MYIVGALPIVWFKPLGTGILGFLYSLSCKASCRKISWSLEAARLDSIMIVSQSCCQGGCRFSEWLETYKHDSRGFVTWRDLQCKGRKHIVNDNHIIPMITWFDIGNAHQLHWDEFIIVIALGCKYPLFDDFVFVRGLHCIDTMIDVCFQISRSCIFVCCYLPIKCLGSNKQVIQNQILLWWCIAATFNHVSCMQ